MLDLCVLIDCVGAGWDYLAAATAINNSGDITGVGYINGEQRAYLVQVSAVPLPAALWLFGTGLLGLIGVARKKCIVIFDAVST